MTGLAETENGPQEEADDGPGAGTVSADEGALAAARAEGRAEAEAKAALNLAAAEFRHAAAGRLSDPGAALGLLDLARLIGKDGQPDPELITAAVDQLAGPGQQEKHGPLVPPGPRQEQDQTGGDVCRMALSSWRRRHEA